MKLFRGFSMSSPSPNPPTGENGTASHHAAAAAAAAAAHAGMFGMAAPAARMMQGAFPTAHHFQNPLMMHHPGYVAATATTYVDPHRPQSVPVQPIHQLHSDQSTRSTPSPRSVAQHNNRVTSPPITVPRTSNDI